MQHFLGIIIENASLTKISIQGEIKVVCNCALFVYIVKQIQTTSMKPTDKPIWVDADFGKVPIIKKTFALKVTSSGRTCIAACLDVLQSFLFCPSLWQTIFLDLTKKIYQCHGRVFNFRLFTCLHYNIAFYNRTIASSTLNCQAGLYFLSFIRIDGHWLFFFCLCPMSNPSTISPKIMMLLQDISFKVLFCKQLRKN